MVKGSKIPLWCGKPQQVSSDCSAGTRFFDSAKSTTLQHSSITSQTATTEGVIVNLSITRHNISDDPLPEQVSEPPKKSQQSCCSAASKVYESSPRTRAQVYYDNLLPQGRGSPLYTPGPDMDLPKEYRQEGVRLGDLVIINNDGSVSYLFNIFAPADDPINHGRVPPSFRPIPKHLAQTERHLFCSKVVMSSSVRSSSSGQGYETSQEGALVAMPSGATSARLINTKFFDKYVERHCETWYHSVLTKGRPVENGDIRLVVGSDKTTTWGTATFLSHESTGGQVVFTPLGEYKDQGGTQYTYQCFGSAEAQTGPMAPEIDDLRESGSSAKSIENQCVFLRTINPYLSEHVYNAIVQRVEVEGFGDCDEYLGSDTEIGHPPSTAHTYEGANVAVQILPSYLNKASFPRARLVITEDRHWMSSITGTGCFPCPGELFERLENAYEFLEEGGVVTIEDPLFLRGCFQPLTEERTEKMVNDGSWLLHGETSQLPPLTDLFGPNATALEGFLDDLHRAVPLVGKSGHHYTPETPDASTSSGSGSSCFSPDTPNSNFAELDSSSLWPSSRGSPDPSYAELEGLVIPPNRRFLSCPRFSPYLQETPLAGEGNDYYPVETVVASSSNSFRSNSLGLHSLGRAAGCAGTEPVDAVSSDSTFVEQATSSPLRTLNISRDEVSCGTMDGLVDYLIMNRHAQQYRRFSDAFFFGYSEFMTADSLFDRLASRFDQAEKDLMLMPEKRHGLQCCVFIAISDWLDGSNFPTSVSLLSRMELFCKRAMGSQPTTSVADHAVRLKKKIDDYITPSRLSKNASQRYGSPRTGLAGINTRDLALALTILEGDNYEALQPCDYIPDLTGKPSDNLAQMYETSCRIFAWVVDSILHYEGVDDRAQVFKMFILTAVECEKMKNFSSSIAITAALHSAPVENLRLTRDALGDQMRSALDNLLEVTTPEFDYRRYRTAMKNAPNQDQKHCIPWIAIHLKDLRRVLHNNPVTVKVDNHHLLNFERCFKVMDTMKEFIQYKPPPLEELKNSSHAAELEKQLQGFECNQLTQDMFMKRSYYLERNT